eukprot:15169979-Alexandrium_andersonii.AAC.1
MRHTFDEEARVAPRSSAIPRFLLSVAVVDQPPGHLWAVAVGRQAPIASPCMFAAPPGSTLSGELRANAYVNHRLARKRSADDSE